MTTVLTLSPIDPDPAVLARAAELLRAGQLVAFPTETVYGLGANALDAVAVAGIYRAKGRPACNPLIVHVPDVNAARSLATRWPESAERLAAQFWPGPLALVLPRGPAVPDIVTAHGPTVALRVPAHPVALGLLRACGLPVAAPSANPANAVSPTTAAHVVAGLSGRVDLVLDAGPTTAGIESTVVDLSGDHPRLLRPGPVHPDAIAAILGETLVGPLPAGAEALPSPGMLARHYSPRTPLELIDRGAARVGELLADGRRVGWLTRTPQQPHPLLTALVLPEDPSDYAHGLYAALHALDAVFAERIIIDALPPGRSWDAVRDRLQRAAAVIE